MNLEDDPLLHSPLFHTIAYLLAFVVGFMIARLMSQLKQKEFSK